jgi:hypothetical protein
LNSPLRTEQRIISPLLGDILDILERYRYVSSSPGKLLGLSGTSHEFDIVARHGINTILISSLTETDPEMLKMKLVSLRAMVWDCSPDTAIVILPQGADLEDAKKYLTMNNFAIIQRENPAVVYQKLEEVLKSKEQ